MVICRALWRILFQRAKSTLARWNKPINSENQLIIRSKQPIKIEGPFQRLLTFIKVLVKKIVFRVFCCHFFSVYFLNALQKDNNSVRVYVLGINIFWVFLRTHFNLRLTARAKMSLSQAQSIFMPTNINSLVLVPTPSSFSARAHFCFNFKQQVFNLQQLVLKICSNYFKFSCSNFLICSMSLMGHRSHRFTRHREKKITITWS